MAGNKATTEGTQRFQERFQAKVSPDHYRKSGDWWVSSIGLGTYLGEPDKETDSAYEASIQEALLSGCNLLDTAINYRFQRSERNIGTVLKSLISSNTIQRDEIIVSTKAGFLSFDGSYPANPARYFHEEYIQPGIVQADDIVAGCHCMTPSYLENQLERSLRNLNLECIDIYFLHNPETQLSEISRQEFLKRIFAAFRFLEKKVSEGKIQMYGTATWDGFRASPNSPEYLSLEELIGLARDAGGENHHFRAIQLPYNLGMTEAYLKKNQKFGSESVSTLQAADLYKLLAMSSASILQGRLSANLPDFILKFFEGLDTDAQRSIQFVRSTPGVSTALIGMSSVKHVKENLNLAKKPPVPSEKMEQLFESS